MRHIAHEVADHKQELPVGMQDVGDITTFYRIVQSHF